MVEKELKINEQPFDLRVDSARIYVGVEKELEMVQCFNLKDSTRFSPAEEEPKIWTALDLDQRPELMNLKASL